METTNAQVAHHTADNSSCHGTGKGMRGWFGRRRNLIIAAAAAVAAVAFALSQHWLSVASLVPLLFVLPCAAMMLVCMKGHHDKKPNAPAATQSGTPDITNT